MEKHISETNSTLLRAFKLLEAVVAANRPVSGADLIETLELPKPTVHRLAQQLEREDLLQREPDGKRYTPGIRLSSLAWDVIANSIVALPRKTILRALSEELGETCNITVLDGNQSVYFDRVETNWPVRIQLPIGTRLPLHCTASGKLYLAMMPPEQRRNMLQAVPLHPYTDRTVTNVANLEGMLPDIWASGLGTDDEEFIAGMVAIAVPVTNAAGHICATVAVHAPTMRKPLSALREHAPALRRAAVALSEVFFGPR
jgi:DNA-binding IclR family transcriptional regulator